MCRSDYEKAELHPITSNNIDQLKFLNTVIFPVVYEDRFYEAALRAGELAKLGEYRFFFVFFCMYLYIGYNLKRVVPI